MKRTHADQFDVTPMAGRKASRPGFKSPWTSPEPTHGYAGNPRFQLCHPSGKHEVYFLLTEVHDRWRKTEALGIEAAIKLLDYDQKLPCVTLNGGRKVFRA